MITKRDYERIKKRNPRYVQVLDSIRNLESEILNRECKAKIYNEKYKSGIKYDQLYGVAYRRQVEAISDCYCKLDDLYDEKIRIEDEELYNDYYCDVEALEMIDEDLNHVIYRILKGLGE